MTRRTSPRRAPNTRGKTYGGYTASGAESRRARSYEVRKAIARNATPPPGKAWCPSCFSAVTVTSNGTLRRHKIPGSMRGAICEAGAMPITTKDDDMTEDTTEEYTGRHRANVELVYENIYGAPYAGKHRVEVNQ